MTVLSAHQPNFLPYLGFFDKIAKSDIFVILDDLQFSNNSYQDFNFVHTTEGASKLKLPVSYNFGAKINQVKVLGGSRDFKKMLKTIEYSYSKSPYFKVFKNDFFELLNQYDEYDNLADYNINLINHFLDVLEIENVRIYRSSAIKGLETGRDERLIDLCLKFGADTYLSGTGGKSYIVEEKFSQNGLKLSFQQCFNNVYPQTGFEKHGFVPNLSVIDYYFNVGNAGLEGAFYDTKY